MKHDTSGFSISRRRMLTQSGAGFGWLGLAATLAQEQQLTAAPDIESRNPLAPKRPHFKPQAKRVIFLFMNGGPSHVDTFDPKPELVNQEGKKGPGGKWMPSPFKFSRHGQSGVAVAWFGFGWWRANKRRLLRKSGTADLMR